MNREGTNDTSKIHFLIGRPFANRYTIKIKKQVENATHAQSISSFQFENEIRFLYTINPSAYLNGKVEFTRYFTKNHTEMADENKQMSSEEREVPSPFQIALQAFNGAVFEMNVNDSGSIESIDGL